MLKANADRAERDRRLPDENITALEQAGVFRLLIPKRHGGLEVNCRTFVDVVAELGRGCGSSAWYAFILGGGCWLTAMLPDAAQNDVWKHDRDARICAILEPSAQVREVDGGLLITGEWAYSSGCHHADWAMLGFPILNEAGEVIDSGGALVPISELAIKDTWKVSGMRATASDTLVAIVRFDCISKFKSEPFHSSHYSNSAPNAKYLATAKKLFKANAAQLPKHNTRPPRIVQVAPSALTSSVVTTDFFGFDTSNNHYHLWKLGDVSEMGDAVLGLVASEMGDASPDWVAVRNVSDPQIKAEGTIKQQAMIAAQIYKGFGRWSSVCSAIVCWALIAAL